MNTQHTPEPWECFEHDHAIGVKMLKGNKTKYGAEPYAVLGGYSQEDKDITRANARRIVACVNACAGSTTDDLIAITKSTAKNWSGVCKEWSDDYQAMKQQLSELQSKLTDVELRCVKICGQRDDLQAKYNEIDLKLIAAETMLSLQQKSDLKRITGLQAKCDGLVAAVRSVLIRNMEMEYRALTHDLRIECENAITKAQEGGE